MVKIFDAHLHIIDSRYPLVPNQGYLPEPFTCNDYLARTRRYELVGGAVVSGSFQAFDQSYLVDALERLGPAFVGVTQLPASVTDEQLLELDAAGVRALRFNLKRGGSEDVRHLERMVRRVHEVVGWHVELYIDSRELLAHRELLTSLPRVSIDHLGLSKDGLATLLRLVEQGVHVKATGFGRVDFDVKAVLRDLYAANPNALMFGTDLPSTRAPRPYRDDDLSLVVDALGEDQADRVLYRNALEFYLPGGKQQ
ncbi:MAG: amidohydrolase family protein [Sedimenticola sp.]